jgi:hypothetical protein
MLQTKNLLKVKILSNLSSMPTLCGNLDDGQSLPQDICLTIIDQLIECSVETFRQTLLNL